MLRHLLAGGVEAEHIIPLGLRGTSDSDIRARLDAEEFLFLTQDVEFLLAPLPRLSRVLVSRIPQSMPRMRRIELWMRALEAVLVWKGPERLFELDPDGSVHPWVVHDHPSN